MSRYRQDSLTERNVDEAVRNLVASGASELDLVRSGLDDTMRMALQNLREVMNRNPAITDYRTTATRWHWRKSYRIILETELDGLECAVFRVQGKAYRR